MLKAMLKAGLKKAANAKTNIQVTRAIGKNRVVKNKSPRPDIKDKLAKKKAKLSKASGKLADTLERDVSALERDVKLTKDKMLTKRDLAFKNKMTARKKAIQEEIDELTKLLKSVRKSFRQPMYEGKFKNPKTGKMTSASAIQNEIQLRKDRLKRFSKMKGIK